MIEPVGRYLTCTFPRRSKSANSATPLCKGGLGGFRGSDGPRRDAFGSHPPLFRWGSSRKAAFVPWPTAPTPPLGKGARDEAPSGRPWMAALNSRTEQDGKVRERGDLMVWNRGADPWVRSPLPRGAL